MAWIPSSLRPVLEEIAETGGAYITTPRSILGHFDAKRRGRNIAGQVRNALKEFGLVSTPDFETAYIDGEIAIAPPVARGAGQEEEVVDDGATVVVVGGSIADPVARVRTLAAANRVPVSIGRDNPVKEAVTIMLMHDFSQLPVMSSGRDVNGMISWRSLGLARSLGKAPEYVRQCMEDAYEVWSDAPLLDAMPVIAEREAVVVRSRDKQIVGLVTTSDLSLEFKALAEPFLLLGEIENHLRRLIDGKFALDTLKKGRDDSDTGRTIEDVSDLTFGEYVRLLQDPANWSALDLPLDRGQFCKRLDRVRMVRNDVMHFNPDPISSEDIELLRDSVKFLQHM